MSTALHFLNDLKESFHSKMEDMMKIQTRDYNATRGRSAPSPSSNSKKKDKDWDEIKEWLKVVEEDEKEYEERKKGLQDLLKEALRETFDYIRSPTLQQKRETDPDSFSVELSETSKWLQHLCFQYHVTYYGEDGSDFIDESLDGSLSVKEKPVDRTSGCEKMLWFVSGYERSLILRKHLSSLVGDSDELNKFTNEKSVIEACERNRIQSPVGASRLSRFSEATNFIEAFGGGMIREARCVVSAHEIPSEGMDVDGDLLALASCCGYKYRSPDFYAAKMTQNSRNTETTAGLFWDNLKTIETGFYEPGSLVTCSKDHSSIACMADRRIKLFDTSNYECTATLQARNCSGAMFIGNKIVTLSHNKNEIHHWNIQDIEKHEPLSLADVQDGGADDAEWLDLVDSSWNDDVMESPENIDVNIGQSPHLKSCIQGLPEDITDIDVVAKNKGSMNHSILIGSNHDPSIYMVDFDQSKVSNLLVGQINTGRFMDIATSAEMPNLVMSGQNDNRARIWDLRCRGNLPVLTLINNNYNSSSGGITFTLAEDMLAFTSDQDQCIRAWDLRAPACLYKLSTGNTVVKCLEYSAESKTLYATVHGGGCPQYFPPKYFPYDWNAYVDRGLMAMQHRTSCSHLITYDFKETVDVNDEEYLPINRERREEGVDSDEEDNNNGCAQQ